MSKKDYGYTIVQHSAMGYKDDYTFQKGLEVRTMTYKKDLTAVQQVGGRVFETYKEANDYAFTEMYPPDHDGSLIPKAKGLFSHKKVDGLRIYIPAETKVVVV